MNETNQLPEDLNKPNVVTSKDLDQSPMKLPNLVEVNAPIRGRLDPCYLGKIAYEQYAVRREWKTFNGDPMPQWAEVQVGIRDAWCDAAVAVANRASRECVIVQTEPMGIDQDPDITIMDIKRLRNKLDMVVESIRNLRGRDFNTYDTNAAIGNALRYAQNTIMWLGMTLKSIGAPNPYPNSRNAENAIVDPTAPEVPHL